MRLVLALASFLALLPCPAQHAARLHHVHLNSSDPEAALRFYPSKFECREALFEGKVPAVLAQRTWLLFDRTPSAPHEITSAIWHIGWGAEDMPLAYEKQVVSGTRFETPLTDISDLVGGKPGSFYYAYVDAPDHVLVELNTANHHSFGHLHLLSADPIQTAAWYRQHLGVQILSQTREPREYRGFPVGPSASLRSGDVNIIIFPMTYAFKAWPDLWRGRQNFSPTKGRAIDHIGFVIDDFEATVERLKAAGVPFESSPRQMPGTTLRSVFLTGPDQIRIELVDSISR